MTASISIIGKRFLCNRPDILTVTISSENDYKFVFNDSCNNYVIDVNKTKEEVGYLNTGIDTFNFSQKTDNPVAVATSGIISIL